MARNKRRAPANRQNTFFGGAAILALGIMVVKVIGMFYKIPLINIIGQQGTADFGNAYNIYAVLLTISTAGLPVAVSKLVSEASATARYNQLRRTFRVALALFLTLGAASFLLMFFRADLLAGMMHDEKAAPGIRALAPAVICVGCLSAFRGYSQGQGNMTPTALSQIIEALCKLVVGLGLAWWLVRGGAGEDIAAAGAITGVTVGTIVALIYMLLCYLSGGMGARRESSDRPERAGTIVKNILRIAIPITLSASMVGIVTVIDSSLVQGRLQKVLLENPESWKLYDAWIDFGPLSAAAALWRGGLGEGARASFALLSAQAAEGVPEAVSLHELLESVSRTLYGNYNSALNIYNLPTSLMAAITASVIPAVSGALARRNGRGAARMTGSALRVSALLAFPMGVGIFVLGTPIIRLIFPGMTPELAGPLLSSLGLATLFVCMMLVCNSILQAYGFVNLPVAVMLLGGLLKIVNNYHLVVLPGVGIFGAPYGNVVCFALCMVLDLILIARVIPGRPSYVLLLAKPAVASALMGLGAWAVYGLCEKLLRAAGILVIQESLELSRTGNALATMLAILAAVVIYAAVILALHGIARSDLELMPQGEKIGRMLHIT